MPKKGTGKLGKPKSGELSMPKKGTGKLGKPKSGGLSTRAKWIIAISVILLSGLSLALGFWWISREKDDDGSGGGGSPTPVPELKCSGEFPGTVCLPPFMPTDTSDLIATATDISEIQKEFGRLPQINDGGVDRDIQEGDSLFQVQWNPTITEAETTSYNDRMYNAVTALDQARRVLVATLADDSSSFNNVSVQITEEIGSAIGELITDPNLVVSIRYNPNLIESGVCAVCS